MATHPSTADERKRERSRRAGNWLISTLAWGPLLLWVAWPLLNDRLAWHPVVGYSGLVALTLNWVYHGQRGVNHVRWPTYLAVVVAFSVSFSVAARSGDMDTFTAVSVVAGGLVWSIASALIVVLAVRAVRVRDYGVVEDTILLAVPLIEAAIMIGITVGSIVSASGSLLLGMVAGFFAGAIVAVFVLAWVYGTIGIVSSWVARNEEEIGPMWWPGEI